MASIHKREFSRFWQCSYKLPNGLRTTVSTQETSKRKALEFARAKEKEMLLLKVLGGEKNTNDSIEGYLLGWVKLKDGEIGEATLRHYRGHIGRFIEYLGADAQRRLTSLTVEQIDGWKRQMMENERAPKTINLALKTLRSAIGEAHKRGMITFDPTAFVKTIKAKANSRDVFTPEEISKLMFFADDDWKGMILLGLYCGMRLRDAAGLKVENVSLEKAVITYNPLKLAGFGKPSVVVPIFEPLLGYLSGRMKGQMIFPALCNVDGGGKRGLSNRFKKIMKLAGVDRHEKPKVGCNQCYGLSFHSLRHSCASWLANAGVPADIRMRILGHYSAAVHGGYTHYEMETIRKSMVSLPSFTGGDQNQLLLPFAVKA